MQSSRNEIADFLVRFETFKKKDDFLSVYSILFTQVLGVSPSIFLKNIRTGIHNAAVKINTSIAFRQLIRRHNMLQHDES